MERKELTKMRWLVLVASCFINLCIGALYAWSVFSGPMAEHLTLLLGKKVTAADLSIVFAVGNATGFITMIGGGFLNQMIGSKRVVFIGGTLFGTGYVFCGFSQNIGMLIIGYGMLSGLAMGLAYGCTISNSVKFFPDKAGLIGGLTTASYGISSVVVPPIANALINNVGVCKAFKIFGIVIIVVVGLCSQFIIDCPVGFVPKGWKPEKRESDTTELLNNKNWKEMLQTPVFYVMLVMLFLGAILGMMVISQASNIAQNMIGMTPAQAAVVVSVLALFNTFGRIIAGMISDKIGCISTLTGVFVVAILAMQMLYFCNNVMIFYIAICLVGTCFGAFMGVYPSFTVSQFGSKNSSVNYGIMFVGFNAAGFFGPIVMGEIFKNSGNYKDAFLLSIGFAVFGLVLSFVYRILVKKNR